MAADKTIAPMMTPERAGEILGVPKSRVKRLVRWAEEAKDRSTSRTKVSSAHGKVVTRKAAAK